MAVAALKHEKDKLPILVFKTAKEWQAWLAKNHAMSKGVWLRIYKKDSDVPSIDRAQSLDEALCYGWIDGQANSYDEESYLQRYSPRRPKSIWSKKNIENIARLTAANKMKPAGLKEVEAAKTDGRWERAYDSPSNMEIPGDFLKALTKNTKANKFFKTLNKTNTFAIGWRLQTAKKPETREKRIKTIIEMLAKGQKFH